MSTYYSAHVELSRRQVSGAESEEFHAGLMAYHAAVGMSPRGWLSAQISVVAESFEQAVLTAVRVTVGAAREAGVHADPVAVEVMTEVEFNVREDFMAPEGDAGEASATLGTSDVAAELGVSRQRVAQLVREGKLTPRRVGQFLGFDGAQVRAVKLARAR